MKPKIFIGSSREGVKIADAIHYNLTRDAECTVWKDGVFQLSNNTLASLIDALRTSDFGIFVFSPDDITIMRGETANTVRDNVLFELGLFIGRLGQERCFFLIPDKSSDLRLPSDLAGVTPGYYESERSDENWMAALSPACMQIRSCIGRLKSFQDAVPSTVDQREETTTNNNETTNKDTSLSLTAEYYKRSILVKGNTHEYKDQLRKVGNWNKGLFGWVIPKSKEKELKNLLPGLLIKEAA